MGRSRVEWLVVAAVGILAEGAIAWSMTLCGGVLFASWKLLQFPSSCSLVDSLAIFDRASAQRTIYLCYWKWNCECNNEFFTSRILKILTRKSTGRKLRWQTFGTGRLFSRVSRGCSEPFPWFLAKCLESFFHSIDFRIHDFSNFEAWYAHNIEFSHFEAWFVQDRIFASRIPKILTYRKSTVRKLRWQTFDRLFSRVSRVYSEPFPWILSKCLEWFFHSIDFCINDFFKFWSMRCA